MQLLHVVLDGLAQAELLLHPLELDERYAPVQRRRRADLADRRDERLRRLALVMARIDDAAAMVDDIEERNRFEARRSLRQAEALVDRIRQPVLLDELLDRLVLPPLAVASDKHERLVLEGLPELLHPRQ